MDGILWIYDVIYAYGWYFWETRTVKNLLTLFEFDSLRVTGEKCFFFFVIGSAINSTTHMKPFN